MTRNESDKKRLKDKAEELVHECYHPKWLQKNALTHVQVTSNDEVEIDRDETTEEDDFKYERSSNVFAVVVDKSSGRGFVQISGAVKPREIVHTGDGESGFTKVDIGWSITNAIPSTTVNCVNFLIGETGIIKPQYQGLKVVNQQSD